MIRQFHLFRHFSLVEFFPLVVDIVYEPDRAAHIQLGSCDFSSILHVVNFVVRFHFHVKIVFVSGYRCPGRWKPHNKKRTLSNWICVRGWVFVSSATSVTHKALSHRRHSQFFNVRNKTEREQRSVAKGCQAAADDIGITFNKKFM